MKTLDQKLGLFSALPVVVLLGLAFLAPLLVVALFSIMPPKVFSLANTPDFSAYAVFVQQGYYKSLLWSLGMALASTAILLVVCWPLAYAMAKIFKRFTLVLTIAIVMSLFVSENIRLFGWVLTLMKGGLIEGHFRAFTGVGFDSPLYGVPIIVFGLVYVYLPFMLFPLAQGIAMVPDDTRQAAYDLGASRWQVLWQIEIPWPPPASSWARCSASCWRRGRWPDPRSSAGRPSSPSPTTSRPHSPSARTGRWALPCRWC